MKMTERLRKFPAQQEYLLNILHEIQNHNSQHYLPQSDLKMVAEYLNMTLSSVYGVATYYSMFSLKPRGKYIIRICRSPVCCIKGVFQLIDEIKKKLSIAPGETTKDGLFTLELSECLGRCELSPSMMINDRYYGGLNKDRLKKVFKRLREENSD